VETQDQALGQTGELAHDLTPIQPPPPVTVPFTPDELPPAVVVPDEPDQPPIAVIPVDPVQEIADITPDQPPLVAGAPVEPVPLPEQVQVTPDVILDHAAPPSVVLLDPPQVVEVPDEPDQPSIALVPIEHGVTPEQLLDLVSVAPSEGAAVPGDPVQVVPDITPDQPPHSAVLPIDHVPTTEQAQVTPDVILDHAAPPSVVLVDPLQVVEVPNEPDQPLFVAEVPVAPSITLDQPSSVAVMPVEPVHPHVDEFPVGPPLVTAIPVDPVQEIAEVTSDQPPLVAGALVEPVPLPEQVQVTPGVMPDQPSDVTLVDPPPAAVSPGEPGQGQQLAQVPLAPGLTLELLLPPDVAPLDPPLVAAAPGVPSQAAPEATPNQPTPSVAAATPVTPGVIPPPYGRQVTLMEGASGIMYSIYFEPDTAVLIETFRHVLDFVGSQLLADSSLRVHVQSYAAPFRTAEGRFMVSTNRALFIRDHFTQVLGIAPERITFDSFGSDRTPRYATDDWRTHRSAEMILIR